MRRSLGSVLVVAIVLGVAGGLSTALFAGATQTSTAGPRLIARTRLADMFVFSAGATAAQVETIREMDGVAGAALLRGLHLFLHDGEFFNMLASDDGRYGVDIDVPRIIAGRAARPDSADEVVFGESLAKHLGLHVGDTLTFDSHTPEQVAAWGGSDPTDAQFNDFQGPQVQLHLVGISRHPADLTSDDPLTYFTTLPPGFLTAYRGRIDASYGIVLVDLGDSPSAAEQEVITDKVRAVLGPDTDFGEGGAQTGGPLFTTLDFVATSMRALAAAIAFAGLIIGALIIARTVSRAAAQTSTLSAMGMTDSQRARAVSTPVAAGALGAGVLAVAVALAAGRGIPFGLAKRVEPDPRLHGGVAAVALGATATVLVALLLGGALAARAVRRWPAGRQRPNAVVERLGHLGLPAAPLMGVDLAVGSGRGGSRGAGNVAVAAVAIATAAGVGALVINASVSHLKATPAAYGWDWDYVISSDGGDPSPALAGDPAVAAAGYVSTGSIGLDGRPVVVRGVASAKGPLPVLVVAGRPPQVGEIVLGRRTMADLHVAVGDTVTAVGSLGQRDLQVVGVAVLAGIIDVPEAGSGAAVALSDLDALGVGDETGAAAVVTLKPGADRREFADRMEHTYGHPPEPAEAPIELARLREVELFPWILGGFLVAVGFVALAHAIVVTSRRRRADLAVLQAMGLEPNGVITAISAQAAVLAILGAAVGVPLGALGGRALWQALARSLGVVVTIDVPWRMITIVAVGAPIAVAMLALGPARRTASASIADALRIE